MSRKWTGSHSESGILRKSEYKEKKEELFVFGYSCKLFRDNDKALHIDQGKHLIPWMGDESLKIDRYDARGALHDLSALEAPPGGFDWRVELTKAEFEVEQLCDEERYRALHTDEDEEEMYKEEELKRLHAAGYGQVGFNYDAQKEPSPAPVSAEIDEPFIPSQSFRDLLPIDIMLPESQKQNAIIEKTAKFIAGQGAQLEILIKAKQRDNPQFQFLNKDSSLNQYYTVLISLIKAGKWPEKKVEHSIEEKPPEDEGYLHPSLAMTVIESAPSIPSIHYKPSADCDYTMLISKMRGEATLDETYTPELAPGEVAPPGTEPLPPRATSEITRAPVMYYTSQNQAPHITSEAVHYQQYHQQYAAYYQHYMNTHPPQPVPVKKDPPLVVTPSKSTGLSLMKNYNTDSGSEDDLDDSSSTDSKDKQFIVTPPEDIKVVIDKMAAYVARNGDEFADIVRAKNDPRFTFLEPDNIYHRYYKKLMQEKRGDINGNDDEKSKKTVPVSFSIKKLKEPDPILPKPALPYESSSDEESENVDKQTDKTEQLPDTAKTNSSAPNIQSAKLVENVQVPKIEFSNAHLQPPKTNIPEVVSTGNIPPAVVYKLESTQSNNLPTVKAIETMNLVQKPVLNAITPKLAEAPEEKLIITNSNKSTIKEIEIQKKLPTPPEKRKDRKESSRESPSRKKEKRKHRERKKDYKSKTEIKASKTSERSAESEKKKERHRENERDKKKVKISKEIIENEIISLEDNSDDMIDLTGDISDSKGDADNESDRGKQQDRRRRAAEFLKKVGVDPAAALPTTSLASAMVDTLESLRKKKALEEEKRRREKRRHRDRRGYEDESERSHRKSKRRKYNKSSGEDSDYESSKRKKRKKEKRHSLKNKKKRKRETETEEDPPLNIDLTSTLKELRTSSPTKQLCLQDIDENTQQNLIRQDSSSDLENLPEEKNDRKKKKKENREYSEGEWSSDSEEDSGSIHSTSRKD